MFLEKNLLPFTNLLRNNNKIINLVLITLLVTMLFPIDNYFPFNPIKNVETELVTLISNPFMMTFLTLLLYCVYLTNNNEMFILLLFMFHRLVIHKGASASAPAPAPAPAPRPKAAPAPKPKAAPAPKPKAAPAPKPKAAPAPKPKAAPAPKPKAAPAPKPRAAPELHDER